MPMTDAWWIEDLERLRKEQSGQQEGVVLQLPLPEPPPRKREDRSEESPRGVVIIDYSVE